jgi:hypothetical protein
VAELAAVMTVGQFLAATAPQLEVEPEDETEDDEMLAALEEAAADHAQQSALFEDEPDEEPEPVKVGISPKDAAEAIRSFKELFDLGAMDEDEFAQAKATVLSQMAGEGVAA